MSGLMNDPEGYRPENRIHTSDSKITVEEILEFQKQKQAQVYKEARECVNRIEPVAPDTSDKLRILVDKLDVLGNTLVDVTGYLDGNPPKPPTYETPSCLLHALYLMELQTEFLLSVAEDIRIKLR